MTWPQSKYIPIEQFAAWRSRLTSFCDRPGATSGCFDLLHIGHVRFLQAARADCDMLIICLNSDESVRKLKGPARPLIPAHERIEMLCALPCVDYVTTFDARTPEGLIPILRPALWFKGADYTGREIPERALVEAHGGRVVLLPYHHGYSTSDLVNRMKNTEEIKE